MEIWDIYDKYRKKTEKTHVKGTKTGEGEYHIAVRVWIVNSQGELLIQRRQFDNITWPGMWEAAASGSAITGDNSPDTAIKETMEEIGLDIEEDILEPIFTVKFKNGFDDNYLIRRDVDIEDLTLENDEVVDVKWATMDEIMHMVSSEHFIPFPFLERVFEIINSKIKITRNIPEPHPTGKVFNEIHIGDSYRIFYKNNIVGNIMVFEKENGFKKLHLMNITNEFQHKGIEEEIMKRIESLHPEVEKWELETISSEEDSDQIYLDIGFVPTGETGIISEELHFTNYIKEDNIYRVEDIVDLKHK